LIAVIRENADKEGPVARSVRTWLLGILPLAGLIAVIANFGELRNFAAMLKKARPSLLLFALLLQVSTFISVAACWTVALAAVGSPRRLRMLIPLSVAKLFSDQAVPSAGLSGNILLVDRLIATGVPRGAAVAALSLSIIGYYAAYAILALMVLLLLWMHHEATWLLAGTVTIFLLVAAAIAAGTLLLMRGRSVPRPRQRFATLQRLLDLFEDAPSELIRNPRLIAKAASLNGLVFLADAVTLWVVLAAIGAPTHFATALIAFIIASIAVTLGPIPMGLGSFEAVSVGMLKLLGVPLEAAVTGTLLLRGLTLWLPLLPGMLLTRRMFRVQHQAPGHQMHPLPSEGQDSISQRE
jgi:uncharacterized protein (TIRG00374 family)